MNDHSETQNRRPVALITGASSGIGAALAERFATEGYDLVLVARRTAELEEQAHQLRIHTPVTIITLPLDLTGTGAVATLKNQLDALKVDVDVLVNNAGAAMAGRFATMAPDAIGRMIDLNVRALTGITHAVLPAMIERRRGRILNLASVAGFQPVPALAAYAATKAYVLSFTEALSEELAKTGVTVTALCPGLTNTPLVKRLGATEIPSFAMLAPAEVAREGFEACMAGEVIRTPGITNRMTAIWSRYQPRSVVRRVAGVVSRFAFDY